MNECIVSDIEKESVADAAEGELRSEGTQVSTKIQATV